MSKEKTLIDAIQKVLEIPEMLTFWDSSSFYTGYNLALNECKTILKKAFEVNKGSK